MKYVSLYIAKAMEERIFVLILTGEELPVESERILTLFQRALHI